ncbi:MAG: PorT family protein [Maribacter sp.]|nr:PorT family protein [Maribacter sp.]
MKKVQKLLLLGVLALLGIPAFAQNGSGFGIKAGINYNQNGDLSFNQVQSAGEDVLAGSNGKIGFHAGFFGKLDFPQFYLKPELVYTKTKSSYNIQDTTEDYDISKLDLPVLLGYKIIGPLSIFAGPSFQYILDNKLKDLQVEDVENKFSVGLNAGVGVSLGKIGLDVRYERGFTQNEANFISTNVTNDIQGKVDARPSQIIFGLSLSL